MNELQATAKHTHTHKIDETIGAVHLSHDEIDVDGSQWKWTGESLET